MYWCSIFFYTPPPPSLSKEYLENVILYIIFVADIVCEATLFMWTNLVHITILLVVWIKTAPHDNQFCTILHKIACYVEQFYHVKQCHIAPHCFIQGGFFSLGLPLKCQSTEKLIQARLGVSRAIYVTVDLPNLGFTYTDTSTAPFLPTKEFLQFG